MHGNPSDYHPDLVSDRLVKVAELIVHARGNALERFVPEIGCDNWTVGCEAYAFTCHEIKKAVAESRYGWLSVVDPTAQFIFGIGDVPVRFYRGTADEPTNRTLRQSFSELHQLTFGFDVHDVGREFAYRIAVETDFDGSVSGVSFVVLSGEVPIFTWEVPLDERGIPAPVAPSPRIEGVELPKPSIGKPQQDRPAVMKND